MAFRFFTQSRNLMDNLIEVDIQIIFFNLKRPNQVLLLSKIYYSVNIFSAYPSGSNYLLFPDSGSRSFRSLARNEGFKNIRQLYDILNLSQMDNPDIF